MTEQQMQFRVGIFVIIAVIIIGALVFQFGEMRTLWEDHYPLAIHFDSAPGLQASTPVRRHGILIGSVRKVIFDEQAGGVLVQVDIQKRHRLPADAQARLVNSLLGDASIEFSAGGSSEFLRPGDRIEGQSPADPMEIVNRLERRMTLTLNEFHSTSHEWRRVAQNLNHLMETNHGSLGLVVERTAQSLQEFTSTMRSANQLLANANTVLADPQHQENLRRTLAALPDMVRDTRSVILAMRQVALDVDENLENLKGVTAPLAKRSDSITANLEKTLVNLQSLSTELNDFSQLLTREDGTLSRFVSDPALYRNLNQSATSLAVLLKNMQPVVRDLRYFSDKIARHPELLGLQGVMRGSSGLKEPPEASDNQQSGPPFQTSVRRQ